MSTGTSVADERVARFLQIGYVLETIVEGRSSQHRDRLPMDRPGTGAVQRLLAEAHEESRCHREQLASVLESLGTEPPSSETISALVEANHEPVDATIEAVLYDQLCSELSAFRYYDSVQQWLLDERVRLELSIPPAEVVTVVENIRQEEQEGVFDVMAAIESIDVTPTTHPLDVRG